MNDTNQKPRGGILVLTLVTRIVVGVAAVGCFFAGLWSVFSHPSRGVMLMGLGIVLGVVFGRVPRNAGDTRVDKK